MALTPEDREKQVRMFAESDPRFTPEGEKLIGELFGEKKSQTEGYIDVIHETGTEATCTPGWTERCPNGQPKGAKMCKCACGGKNHGKATQARLNRVHGGF